jgi:hypothetical protein
LADEDISTVYIYNLQGVKMEERQITGNMAKFNIVRYPKGIYLVRVLSNNGKYAGTGKIIKN